MNSPDFGERLKYLIENVLKEDATDFATKTTIGDSNLTRYTKGKKDGTKTIPGQDKLEYIMKSYPQVNMEWLIGGIGEPLKESKHVPDTLVKEHPLYKALEERVRRLESALANFLIGGKPNFLNPMSRTAFVRPNRAKTMVGCADSYIGGYVTSVTR